MKTSIILNEKDTNNADLSMTISNANPAATDAQLYNFAAAMNSLTDNTFVSAVRRDESELTAPDTLSGGAN